jgi:glycosyl hydrolase family 42 (putative beta-galactosidase)/uncharacterized protein DUF4350
MKNIIKLIIILISLSWGLIGLSETVNLIKNYDFEQELTSQNFWTGGNKVSRTDKEKYKGNYAAQIQALEAETGSNIRLYSDYMPYIDGSLTISVWLKAKNIASGKKSWNVGLFHIFFYDKNKKQIGSHSSIKGIKGSTNWEEVQKIYYPASMKKDKWHSIPLNTVYIRLEFLLSDCTGALLIDDVKVMGKKKIQVKEKNNQTDDMSASEKAEYARLLLATRKPKKNKLQHKDEGNLLVMEDVILPPKQGNPQKEFPNVPNLEVKKGDIYLNGKPALMLGVENHFRLYPFLFKLLGMDYVVLAVSDSANTKVHKLDSRAFHVSWNDYKWLDTMLKMLADEGLWSYIDFWIGGLPVRDKFPDMVIQDPPQHFIWLRFTHPEVRRYLYNYSRSIAKISRKYPVFAYELLNEIMYTSPYHPDNLAIFRKKMAKKYKAIDKANHSWSTSFNSFAEIVPPKKGGVSGSVLNLPSGFSQKLFCEYTEFSEELLAGHIKDWKNDFKKSEPDGLTLVQAINGMWMDYGNQGVNPELVINSEDALGCECGITFIPQPAGSENLESIKNMTLRLMTRDVWRSISPDKPLIDGESPLSVASPPIPEPFINLEGTWQFKSYASDEGKNESKRQSDTIDSDPDKSWTMLDYDDSSWKAITVPAMWGKEGFPKTFIGLYRKKISIPTFKGPLYLAGKQLADYADIYINGKLVWQTKIWSENFCINVAKQIKQNADNEIAIRLYNKYYEGGIYWGGIRGSIQLVKSSAELRPLTEGQMRSYLWSSAVHGYSATTITYFYSGEGIDYPFSLFNPAYISRETLKVVPKVKKELETLAEIVLPRPRIKGKVGLFYPFEAFRYHVPKDAVEALRAPLSKNLLDYYQALLFSQIPFDMVTSQQIIDGKADHYKALIFRMADLIKPGVVEKLKLYADNGGLVIIDHGSLQAESEFYKPLDITSLTGITLGQPILSSKLVHFSNQNLPEAQTLKRYLSDSFGINISTKTASNLAAYQDGTPAITINKTGKGNVIYIGCELPYDTRKAFLNNILTQYEIESDISVAGADNLGRYVEGHQFTKDNRNVWYLNNWGENAEITVKPVAEIAGNTSYRIRDIVTDKQLKSPTSNEFWSAADINNGIPLTLNSQNPITLLIEPSSLTPLKRLKLTTAHQELLKKTWNRSQKADYRILVDCKRSSLYSPARTASLVWLLEKNNYQILNCVSRISSSVKATNNDLITEDKLANFNVLSLPGIQAAGGTRGFSEEELKAIKQYVKNGGGLFLSGQFMRGPHGHMSNTYVSKVAELFGIKILRDAVADPENHIMNESRFVTFNTKSNDLLLKGVSKFQSMGMAPLQIKNNGAIVISTSGTAHAMYNNRLKGELPVMASVEYGKGRVVIMGDASWLQPFMLDRADNAQLALNIFNWLAQRPIEVIPKEKLHKIIDTGI